MNQEAVSIKVTDLSPEEALALAQLCKRVYSEALRPLAGSDTEAEAMFWALARVRNALAEQGYAPR